MIKSPLRYPGGKSRAVEFISTLLPNFDEFREPFVGGGSLFVFVKQTHPQKKFWINDIYFELFKLWEIAQKNMPALIQKIYQWKQEFLIGKELHQFLNKNLHHFNNIERVATFFIYNRITFSGTSLSERYSEGSFTGRFTESSIERLNDLSKIIDDTIITNLSYEEVVKKEGNNVFIFLDPPYYVATQSALYGKNGNLHKTFDHQKFADIMKNCQHKWLITYDDSDYIRSLFSFAYIHAWNLTYGMRNVNDNSNQVGKGLFISNYLNKISKDKTKQLSLFSV